MTGTGDTDQRFKEIADGLPDRTYQGEIHINRLSAIILPDNK